MNQHFFHTSLLDAGVRIQPSTQNFSSYLDKNEQSLDLSEEVKDTILQGLKDEAWNRYPAASYKNLEQLIADYAGIKANEVALSAGSAGAITTLLNYFAIQGKQIIINQPTYSLFHYHCATYGITYESWPLDAALRFDPKLLPAIGNNAVVIITSPNNPTGNVIEPETLKNLLELYPNTLFLLDGVYTEFAPVDFTSWVQAYPNLMVLRSFSKAFPVAGIRLGYICANEKSMVAIKKLLLQFSINPFTLLTAKAILQDPQIMQHCKTRVKEIMAERKRMFQVLKEAEFCHLFRIFEPHGNFLLLQCKGDVKADWVVKHLANQGLKVLDTSNFTQLDETFRISVGTKIENDKVLSALQDLTREGAAINYSIKHELLANLV